MRRFLASRDDGVVCLFGAPFDSTTSSRPGARFGPSAIREASHGLETFSPMFRADLSDCSFMDMGDLELPFGDPNPALNMIEEVTRNILARERVPYLLGGEHLLSLGALRAVSHSYPGVRLVHLDAHADLRQTYLGQELSHATVIWRISEIIGIDSIRQIGIRSCTREEYPLVEKLSSNTTDIITWAGGAPCYITCDLDILDPSVLPGTGTPEPGGFSFQDLLSVLVEIIAHLRIVGIDMVELAPNLDHSGVSALVAAKLVRECIIAMNQKETF
ncbi:MAG: agmatinase [Desulfomonilia bacterium]